MVPSTDRLSTSPMNPLLAAPAADCRIGYESSCVVHTFAQYCEVTGTIGSPTFEVLYTFNESTPLDTTSLGTTLYGQLGSLMGSGTYSTYSTQFMQACRGD